MSIRLGDIAPNFTAQTSQGQIDFHSFIDTSWAILFSHPADFTPICTTELGRVASLAPEFDKRGVKRIALSVDDVESHLKWIVDIEESQKTHVDFPIIADPNFEISNLYGFVHPNASDRFTVRSVVIIGPDKKIKLLLTYPASTGRNFEEILRVIDALQLSAEYPVATPADWKNGDDVVVAGSLNDSEAKEKFPLGFNAVTPYLRFTPQPNK